MLKRSVSTSGDHPKKSEKKAPTDPRRYAIVFVMVLSGLIVVAHVMPSDWYAQYIMDTNQDMLVVDKVEGVYEATATILALVSFGSVLGIRLSTNKDASGRQLGGLLLVSGGSLHVIVIQVLVMGGVCCGSYQPVSSIHHIDGYISHVYS